MWRLRPLRSLRIPCSHEVVPVVSIGMMLWQLQIRLICLSCGLWVIHCVRLHDCYREEHSPSLFKIFRCEKVCVLQRVHVDPLSHTDSDAYACIMQTAPGYLNSHRNLEYTCNCDRCRCTMQTAPPNQIDQMIIEYTPHCYDVFSLCRKAYGIR